MPEFRDFTVDDAMQAAARALSEASGHAVVLGNVSDLGGPERRNLILRAVATGTDGSQPVIVKATRAARYQPDLPAAYDQYGLIREWAACALLARRAGAGSALLAADLRAGVLVFADLGADLPSLVQPLLHGTAAEAERALAGYARSLARLHRETADCVAEHAAIIHAALPQAELPPLGAAWRGVVPGFLERVLGDALPEDELAAMEQRLRAPGAWLSLVHRDPCPDNIVFAAPDDARLIDFEFTGPGHALLDATYWRMGFPTCWCAGRVPDDVADRLDLVYREAAGGFGAAADDVWQREQAIIGMLRLFAGLEWLLESALAEDRIWGIAGNRSRILHYLETATGLCTAVDILPATCRIAFGWLDRLRLAWPEAAPLPPYPAFAQLPN